MAERLSAPPRVDRELAEAGFSKGAAREVKGAARDLRGVPVAAGREQLSWTPRNGYAIR